MADNYDGSVKIDTELDNEGFEQGSEKMKNAVEDLAKSVETAANKAAQSVSQTKVIDFFADMTDSSEAVSESIKDMKKSIDDIEIDEDQVGSRALGQAARESQKAVEGLRGALNRMAYASAQGFNNTSSVLAFSQNIDDAADRLEHAKRVLKEFAEQKIPTDDYQFVVERINKAEKALLQLYARRDVLQDMGVDESSKQWERLQLQIKDAEDEVERFEMDADRMRETGKAFIDPKSTEQYRQMSKELAEQERQLDANRAIINSEAIAQARLNVETAKEKVLVAETAQEREAAMLEMRMAQLRLQEIASESVTPKVDEEALTGWQRFKQVMQSVGSVTARVLRGVGKIVTTFYGSIGRAVKGSISLLKRFTSHTKAAGNSTNALLKGMRSFKQMIISRVKRTFIDYLVRTISDSIKTLALFDSRFDLAVSNLRNRTSELGANITVALGNLIRQIEPLITHIINAASEAMAKLNAIIAVLRGEEVVTVAKQRTESYAASLDSAAEKAKKAKEAQDKLNATLTSYDEIHKLSADDAATAQAGASEIDPDNIFENVPVEGILGDMSDFGKDIVARILAGVVAGDWPAVGDALAFGMNIAIRALTESLPDIRTKAEALAESIAEGINGFMDKFNPYALGNLLAQGINLIFGTAKAFIDTMHWEMLGMTIANSLNGLVRGIDWKMIADTLGGGINAAIDTAFGFVDNFDWAAAGESLSTFVTELFDDIDWGKAWQTISGGLSGISTMITTFWEETNFDFSKLGTMLAGGINWAFQNIPWAEAGSTLAAAVRSLIDTAFELFSSVEWTENGAAVGTGLNSFIAGIDWGKLAHTLSQGVIGALNFLAGALEEADWTEIGSAIAEFFAEIDYGKIASALASGIGAAIGSIGQLLYGVFSALTDEGESWGEELFEKYGEQAGEGVLGGLKAVFMNMDDWANENIASPLFEGIEKSLGIEGFKETALKVYDAFKTAIKLAFVPFASSMEGDNVFENIGDDIGDGVKTGISNAFKKMTKWVQDHVVEPVATGIKNAFGIASPAKEMMPLGEYIGEGLLDGIAGVFDKIGDWTKENVFTPIKNGLTKAFNIVGGAAQALESTGQSISEGIKAGIADKWGTITGYFEEKKEGFVEAGSGLAEKVSEGVKGAWELVKEAFGGGVDSLKQTDTSGFEKVGESVATGVKNGLTSTNYGDVAAQVTAAIGAGIENSASNIAGGADRAVNQAVEQSFEKEGAYAKGRFRAAGNVLGEALSEGLSESFSITLNLLGEDIPQAAKDAIIAALGSRSASLMRNIGRTAASAIAEIDKNSSISLTADTMVSGLNAVADKLSTIAQQFLAIGRAFGDFTTVGYPAVAMGMLAPPKTAVTYSVSGQTDEKLIDRLMTKIDELQKAIDSRPITVESKVNIDGREVGRAAASYAASNSRIGNGGVYR